MSIHSTLSICLVHINLSSIIYYRIKNLNGVLKLNILKKLLKNLKNIKLKKCTRQKNKPLEKHFKLYDILNNLIESNKSELNKYSYDLLKLYNLILKENDVLMYPRGNCVNLEDFNRFINNVNNNITDYVRIVSFGPEGQLSITSVFFSNSNINLVVVNKGSLGTDDKAVAIYEYNGKSIRKTQTKSSIRYDLELDNGELELIITRALSL